MHKRKGSFSERIIGIVEDRPFFSKPFGGKFYRLFGFEEAPLLIAAQKKVMDLGGMEKKAPEIINEGERARLFGVRAKATEYAAGGLSGVFMGLCIAAMVWMSKTEAIASGVAALASFLVSALALKAKTGFEVAKDAIRKTLAEDMKGSGRLP